MFFDDDFIGSIAGNPVDAAIDICGLSLSQIERDSQVWSEHEYGVLIEAYALLVEIFQAKLIPIAIQAPSLKGNANLDCQIINEFLNTVNSLLNQEKSKLHIDSLRQRFRTTLSGSFAYEFSQGDLDRVQILVSELRDLIRNSVDLDPGHKQRLLERLERLQRELHKKISDLDRFWGLIGDAGVVLGKLGKDAKPIVDRIREIAGIVWQTQARSEELPTGSSLPSVGTDGLDTKTRES